MVSDVAILIGHALRAFLTAKVVFLKEHGSVAWSGSARSELADLCLLSAPTPDAERRKYSAICLRASAHRTAVVLTLRSGLSVHERGQPGRVCACLPRHSRWQAQ